MAKEKTEFEAALNVLQRASYFCDKKQGIKIYHYMEHLKDLYKNHLGVSSGLTERGLIAEIYAVAELLETGKQSSEIEERLAKHQKAASSRELVGNISTASGVLATAGTTLAGGLVIGGMATVGLPVLVVSAGVGCALTAFGIYSKKQGSIRNGEAEELKQLTSESGPK